MVALFGLAVFGGTAHGNLITNGDFETDGAAPNGSNATGWTKSGAYGLYDGSGNGGPYAGLRDYVPGNGTNTTVGAYQTLTGPLVGGTQYTLSFYANPWVAQGRAQNVRVGQYNGGSYDSDASYGPLPLSVIDTPTVDAWEFRSYTFTAVGGENTVYFGTAPGATGNQGCDIDNVSLTVIPEPSTIALSALGLLGLLAWGRRRRR